MNRTALFLQIIINKTHNIINKVSIVKYLSKHLFAGIARTDNQDKFLVFFLESRHAIGVKAWLEGSKISADRETQPTGKNKCQNSIH